MKCDFSIPKTCTLPETHKQLEAAHIAWHQLRGSSTNAEYFSANLNALLQAIRNVTFRLQAEKHRFDDFDWYAAWSERAKLDQYLRWLVLARNQVVKAADLETLSSIKATLCLDWEERPVFHFAMPPSASADEIAKKAREHLRIPDSCPALILLERKWIVPDFPQVDVFEILKHGLKEMCILTAAAHDKLKGSHDCKKVAVLASRCTAEDALETIALSRHGTAEIEARKIPEPTKDFLDAVRNRYGSDLPDPDTISNPDKLFEHAKKLLVRDGYHVSLAIIKSGDDTSFAQLSPENRAEKVAILHQLGKLVKNRNADSIVVITEIWAYPPNGSRREGLQLAKACKDGSGVSIVALFRREGNAIEFEEISKTVGLPEFLKALYSDWASPIPKSEVATGFNLTKNEFGAPEVKAHCLAEMRPAMVSRTESIRELAGYSVARNIPASLEIAQRIPMDERQAVVQDFTGKYRAILDSDLATSCTAFPFLHPKTIHLWSSPRIELITNLLASREIAMDAARRFWASLLKLHEAMSKELESLNPISTHSLQKRLTLLRLIEGFTAEFLGSCSMKFGKSSHAIVTATADSSQFIQVPLSPAHLNSSLGGLKFPHPFFENNLPLLSYIVSLGPNAVRHAFSDGDRLDWGGAFSGSTTSGTGLQAMADFSFRIAAETDLTPVSRGGEFVLKIPTAGLKRIVVSPMATDSPAQVFLIKFVFGNNNRELGTLLKNPEHNCGKTDCRALSFGNILVDFWSNSTVAAIDPSFQYRSAANLAQLMCFATAFIRDVAMRPKALISIRKRGDREEFRISKTHFDPTFTKIHQLSILNPEDSALELLFI